MTDIKINDIKLTGAELFSDSESFLHQLSDIEIIGILGGKVYPLYNMDTKIISYIENGK